MRAPASLPATMFLLALDVERGRLQGRDRVGYLLRAAALTDLAIRERLTDEDGKVRVAGQGPGREGSVPDRVLAELLERLSGAAKPRTWKYWVKRDSRRMTNDVQHSLETGGWIRTEPRRVLGLFPGTTISVHDPELVRRLREDARTTLTGPVPATEVEPWHAAVVALACAGELKTVVSRAERRAYKQRIAELGESAGAAAPALSKVLSEIRAAVTAAVVVSANSGQ